MNKLLTFTLKLLVTGVLLLWIGRNVDWREVGTGLTQMGVQGWLGALFLITVQNIFAALRWHSILGSLGQNVSWWRSLRYFYIGSLFNQTLPASIGGDIARVWLMKRAGHPVSEVLNSLLLDRLFPLLGLAVLILVTETWWVKLTHQSAAALVVNFSAAGLAMVLVLVTVFAGRISREVRSPRIVQSLLHLLIAVRRCFRSPRNMFPPLLASMVGFSIMSVLVWTLARHMGIQLDLPAFLVLCPPVFLAASLPVSIAGWGMREGAMVFVFSYVAIPPAQSLSLSIALGLVVLLGSLPAILFVMSLVLHHDSGSRGPGGLSVIKSHGQAND